MSREYYDAAGIHPGNKKWTIIVQVLERHPVLYKKIDYYPFQKRFRHHVFTVMKGTKFAAVVYDKDVDFFERSLEPFKRYSISNAHVSVALEKYRIEGFKYSWTITYKTPVDLIIDDQPHALPCRCNVCLFTELYKFARSDHNIAIKALVVHRFPVMDIGDTKCAKDYMVVNEEGIPMVLRLWKDLLEDYDPNFDNLDKVPVTIIATNLEVNTFHGLSLASRYNTYLLQDPPLSPDVCLKKWYADNKSKVNNWVRTKAYKDARMFFVHPEPEQILDIRTDMSTIDTMKKTWVKAKVKFNYTLNALYIMSCSNCSKITESNNEWKLTCTGCNTHSPLDVSIKLPVVLFEESNKFNTVINSPDAEKICPFTAAQLQQIYEEGEKVLDQILIAMDNIDVICFIKWYDKKINGEILRRYHVLKMYTESELNTLAEEKHKTLSEQSCCFA